MLKNPNKYVSVGCTSRNFAVLWWSKCANKKTYGIGSNFAWFTQKHCRFDMDWIAFKLRTTSQREISKQIPYSKSSRKTFISTKSGWIHTRIGSTYWKWMAKGISAPMVFRYCNRDDTWAWKTAATWRSRQFLENFEMSNNSQPLSATRLIEPGWWEAWAADDRGDMVGLAERN